MFSRFRQVIVDDLAEAKRQIGDDVGGREDFEFSRRTMEEHWQTGYRNARQTLANPEVLELPDRLEGVRTFDIGEERP